MSGDSDGGRAVAQRDRGPSFDAPPPLRSDPDSAPTPPPRRDFRPPRRNLATALTIAALVLVGGVVVVSSQVGSRNEPTARPVAVRTTPRAISTVPTNQVPFGTAYGDGVLTVVGHRWSPGGDRSPVRTLTVDVRIRAIQGEIEVDPAYFQVLDVAGQSHDRVLTDPAASELTETTLEPGQTARGTLRFWLPPGEVTLLMGDSGSGVTAIKIPA